MEETGEVLSNEKLVEYYQRFKTKFSPEVLNSLDGESLLNNMHNSSNKDSLVYWEEFKNDDEMPARFGSIAGGSTLIFGIYRRGDTGNWMADTSKSQVVLKPEEAIQIARINRDQLSAGVALLEKFSENASDDDYLALEANLNKVAPNVSNTAWGHKYFSMMFPNKLGITTTSIIRDFI